MSELNEKPLYETEPVEPTQYKTENRPVWRETFGLPIPDDISSIPVMLLDLYSDMRFDKDAAEKQITEGTDDQEKREVTEQ